MERRDETTGSAAARYPARSTGPLPMIGAMTDGEGTSPATTASPPLAPAIAEFGECAANATYLLRPGGYALILDGAERLAVVRGSSGLYLPGGGQEDGESPAAAACREAIEECGLEIALLHCLGVADELVYAPREARHFRKRCTFFAARVLRQRAEGGEHPLQWLPTAEALETLRHHRQRWALARLLAAPRRA